MGVIQMESSKRLGDIFSISLNEIGALNTPSPKKSRILRVNKSAIKRDNQ
jgi:hypothetical protein